MKNTKQRTAFLRNRAAVLTLAASLVIMGLFTACPNSAGGGSTPQSKYTVNFNVEGGNGTLTAKVDGAAINSGAQVEKGKTVTFTATPAEGYRVKGWTLDGMAVNGMAETYPLTVTKTSEVKVSFESGSPKYTVTFGVDGANGTLTAKDHGYIPITTGVEIEKGKTVRFTAVPAPGYMTGSWTIEGGSFEAGTGTPENPLANVTVSAPLTVKVSFKPADTIPLSKLDIEGTILKGFKGGENPAGKLQVPAGITEIAEYAFKDCTGITEVHLPESLTKIGTYAFYDCEGIIKLTMGKNLTHIAYGAFNGCKNLEGRLEFPPNLAEIGGVAFSKCLKISALDFSKCTQPLTIGEYAFQGCEITGTVKLPASLSSLGEGAFWNCSKVEFFDFYACKNPPLTAIGTDAFNYTTGRFKVKTGTGIKELLTASGVAAGRIDEES